MKTILGKKNGQKGLEMGQVTFSRLISGLVCNNDSLSEGVGFHADLGKFSVRFRGEIESDYDLIVEEFGKEAKDGEWTEMEPTIEQSGQMRNIIIDKVGELRENIMEETRMEMSATEMQDTYNHINVNFYNGY